MLHGGRCTILQHLCHANSTLLRRNWANLQHYVTDVQMAFKTSLLGLFYTLSACQSQALVSHGMARSHVTALQWSLDMIKRHRSYRPQLRLYMLLSPSTNCLGFQIYWDFVASRSVSSEKWSYSCIL
jgi:hypothetical protein